MEYFEKVQTAKCMTISECADWLAFGRLPAPDWYLARGSDIPQELRRDVETIKELGGGEDRSSMFFDSAFLRTVLPTIDPVEFGRNLELCDGWTPTMVVEDQQKSLDILADLRRDGREIDRETQEFFTRSNEEVLRASVWLERATAPLQRLEERARSEVFQALFDSKIASFALRHELDHADDSDVNWNPDELQSVPANRWVNSKIDWKKSNLKDLDDEYLGVTVDTSDVLSLFPIPRMEPIPISGQLYGHTLLINRLDFEPESKPTRTSRRGAPTAGENLLQNALVREFTKRYEAGSLPTKGEAIISEAQLWVKERIGEELKRATAQRYLSSLLSRKPKAFAKK